MSRNLMENGDQNGSKKRPKWNQKSPGRRIFEILGRSGRRCSRSRLGPRVLVVFRSFAPCTRGGVEGGGGLILSIKIVFWEPGVRSSRRIA